MLGLHTVAFTPQALLVTLAFGDCRLALVVFLLAPPGLLCVLLFALRRERDKQNGFQPIPRTEDCSVCSDWTL